MQAKAWVARDQAALERLWSPEFVLNAPSNQILTREGVFREMKTPGLSGGLVSMKRIVDRVTRRKLTVPRATELLHFLRLGILLASAAERGCSQLEQQIPDEPASTIS
ncbi:MAG: nuclear transport factor 2 family protein [Acidobacteria bacterium]|nr:nuclear transport factor 2 family protein [Acidobacteriota bacterium]